MCRLFIGLTFGVLEPAFLLLVLFACFYAARRQHGDDDDYDGADGGGAGGAGGGDAPRPNLFILALTVGLTLPMCAAQVFAALFSRVITQLRYHEDLMREFFAASVGVPDAMACPPEERVRAVVPLARARRGAVDGGASSASAPRCDGGEGRPARQPPNNLSTDTSASLNNLNPKQPIENESGQPQLRRLRLPGVLDAHLGGVRRRLPAGAVGGRRRDRARRDQPHARAARARAAGVWGGVGMRQACVVCALCRP